MVLLSTNNANYSENHVINYEYPAPTGKSHTRVCVLYLKDNFEHFLMLKNSQNIKHRVTELVPGDLKKKKCN